MCRYDTSHLIKVRRARKEMGLSVHAYSVPVESDLVGRKIINPQGREGVVERVVKQWHFGWYEVLLVRYPGNSHGTVFWRWFGEFGPLAYIRKICEDNQKGFAISAE